MSKIYEHVVFEQLLNYMEDNKLFYDDQFGFDTLDHDIMLSKLRYYGVSEIELKMFQIISWKGLNMLIT